jgi:hypothetical protein
VPIARERILLARGEVQGRMHRKRRGAVVLADLLEGDGKVTPRRK